MKNLFTDGKGVEAAGLFTSLFAMAKTAGGAIQGLFKLYKELQGEKPRTVLADQSNRTTIFVMGSGNEIIVELNTAKLYTNEQVLKELDQVVRPLTTEGIDVLEVRQQEELVDRIQRDDLPTRLLEAPALQVQDVASLNAPREVLLKVTKVNFESGNWTFSDGSTRFKEHGQCLKTNCDWTNPPVDANFSFSRLGHINITKTETYSQSHCRIRCCSSRFMHQNWHLYAPKWKIYPPTYNMRVIRCRDSSRPARCLR